MIQEAKTYNLKLATDLDYDFIYETARVTMYDYVDQIWGWDEDYQSSRFRELFRAEEWNIVTVDGASIGCVNCQHKPTEVFLSNIYIRPEYQDRGIGSSIIRGIQDIAKASRLPLRLNVLTTNQRAFQLYQRLGFHIVESTSDKHLMST